VSAGQVESAWPSGPEADRSLIPVAAPLVMPPLAPRLEVRQVIDSLATPPAYKADVRVSLEPSPRVRRVDLHRVRVDDAARELDTMGPPIASLSTSDPTWTVDTEPDEAGGTRIRGVRGRDTPTGSWKRVWYRAVAWSPDDPVRGHLGGRSRPSGAFWVVVPPPTPPDLSPVSVESPGGPPTDVLLRFTSRAPVSGTPLGPHRLEVYALLSGKPSASTPPLFTLESELERVGTTAPASGSGAWRALTLPDGSVEYRVLLRRASRDDALSVAIRLTDPLGRTSERLVHVPPGAVAPEPDLFDVEVSKVAGGVVLGFSTHAPLTSTALGSYRVRVTALVPGLTIPLPPTPVPVPPPPPRPVPVPPLPGPLPPPVFRPLPGIPGPRPAPPGPSIPVVRIPGSFIPDLGLPGPRIPFPRPRTLVQEAALGDVPGARGGGAPPGEEPLVLYRLSGGAAPHRFGALCRQAASRFTVRITAPDGRFAEVTREVR
jgi:hypothetical protein